MTATKTITRLVVAALAVAGLAVVPEGIPAASTAAAIPAPGAAAAPIRTVTLITGDVVTSIGAGYSVEPGNGRAGVGFRRFQLAGRAYVIPLDAQSLIDSGQLDRELFNVTALLSEGYDDQRRKDLPLLVQYGMGTQDAAGAQLSAVGVMVTRELPSITGAALRAPKANASKVWQAFTANGSAIQRVWLDSKLKPTLDQSVPQIGAPAAWQAGFTGKGVKVAIVDTGIDATHPDLAGKITETRNFTTDPDTDDRVGHGTHVASIIAGSGAVSAGQYRGVAPDAELVVGKVCVLEGCERSAILAGLEWAASRAAVVNISLGGEDFPGVDPLEQAVNTLTAQTGALFVVSAGNAGPRPGSIGSPGSADAALTVGAVDRQDRIAEFSSRGPRAGGGLIKPDLTAPGVDIVAAKARNSQIGTPVGEQYLRLSGTSMAAPHVTGAAALLAQRQPAWKAPALKASLVSSARPSPGAGVFEQGTGRVDLAGAINQPVTVSSATVSLGVQRWPHNDDAPATNTITYRNTGPTPVTLNLTASVTGPDGKPAPERMFTLSPAQVVVAPGATTQVVISADTRLPGPDGVYTGVIVASTGDRTLRTLVSVDKEVESYDLTLTHRDRTGAGTARFASLLLGVDASTLLFVPADPDGTVTVRLPRGRYHLDSTITSDQEVVSLLVAPGIDLRSDTQLAVDARTARRVEVSVPKSSARSIQADLTWQRPLPDHHGGGGKVSTIGGLLRNSFDHVYSAQIGPKVADTELLARVESQWAEPGPAGDFVNSPYQYNLAWYERGQLPTGFRRDVRPDQLAVVTAERRTPKPGRLGASYTYALPAEGHPSHPPRVSFQLPSRRTEYYLANEARWFSVVFTANATSEEFTPETAQESAPTRYRPGQRTTELWNAAVFGPGFPDSAIESNWVGRNGNFLLIGIPLYGDQTANHAGVLSQLDSGSTVVYRDGTKFAEFDPIHPGAGLLVPDADAEYRLETTVGRSGVADLSTHITANWTFRSAKTSEGSWSKLPLMAVRFAPRLDLNNTAPTRTGFLLPVTVQRQPGSTPSALTHLAVEVSYDDGTTWQAIPLLGRGEARLGVLRHPKQAGFVSLRASATDAAGNRVEQTMIRAYRIA